MNTNSFLDLDKDIRRPFAVDEQCYDCGEFYAGCHARPSNPPTRCRDYLRLPDVVPGTCGQTFPPSRMQGRKEPRLCREVAGGEEKHTPTQASPRRCECGAALPKSKRLCDACRTKRRQQTMREYKRRWRAEPAGSDVLSDVPLSATATHATHATADDLPPSGHPAGVGCPAQTSVGQNPTPGGEQT